MGTAFVIDSRDNVATALEALSPGSVRLTGSPSAPEAVALEPIPLGHKLSLRPIEKGEAVIKYGICIGLATEYIPAGVWVHLHRMKSRVDDRSSHLDIHPGAPTDITYA